METYAKVNFQDLVDYLNSDYGEGGSEWVKFNVMLLKEIIVMKDGSIIGIWLPPSQ